MGRESTGKGKAKGILATSRIPNTAHYIFYLHSWQNLITSRMLPWLVKNIYLALFCLHSLIEHVVTVSLHFIGIALIEVNGLRHEPTLTLSWVRHLRKVKKHRPLSGGNPSLVCHQICDAGKLMVLALSLHKRAPAEWPLNLSALV